jgi:hypothetical protein
MFVVSHVVKIVFKHSLILHYDITIQYFFISTLFISFTSLKYLPTHICKFKILYILNLQFFR